MDAAESAVLLGLRPAAFFDCSGLRLLLYYGYCCPRISVFAHGADGCGWCATAY
ncbi:hypothetical protein [Streptomyces rimosus]|uniref:hypothetical protein n=1 Tax=Streptomyces rimosus TaxID=1927 RepID=UPI0013317278|nr:hypothetical protein [Streptomyces rimosus]